mmetsp:Transcript_22113/g.43524  ORF Transcript_22113/g.43524 Transcript_22113/m.43524 type:complete len:397 (+) Transcript_22113:283-1473(+)
MLTPMFELVQSGDIKGVEKALRDDPGKVNKIVTTTQDTPLTWALNPNSGMHPEIAEFLVQHNAQIDAQNEEGWNALMLACRYDQPEIALSLIHRGANLDAKKHDGGTALMIACRHGQAKIAEEIIHKDVDVNAQDVEGWTALMLACHHDLAEIAQLLIARGANLDFVQSQGWTALMFACSFGLPKVVEAIIKRGANLNKTNNNGSTALMLACAQPLYAHVSQESLLEAAKACWAGGADPHIHNIVGQTALLIAQEEHREDAVRFLEFVTSSELAIVLRDQLEMPRSVAITFYNNEVLTSQDCAQLRASDLEAMGIDTVMKRRKLLNFFSPSPAPPSPSIEQSMPQPQPPHSDPEPSAPPLATYSHSVKTELDQPQHIQANAPQPSDGDAALPCTLQ